MTCAKLLSLSSAPGTVLLLEAHAEPGGSAGYFSRGFPRRSFDAGATQLVECSSGQLQAHLFSLGQGSTKTTPSESQLFEPINSLTQHWPQRNLAVELSAQGHVTLLRGELTPKESLEPLQNFLQRSHNEASWMWNLLGGVPRFPPQSFADVQRALLLFWRMPLLKKILIPLLFLCNTELVARLSGIRKNNSVANDVVKGLLIDTTQTSAQHAPWLAGCMGLSILTRGIVRVRGGMRFFFRKLLGDFTQHGGLYRPSTRVVEVRTVPEGYALVVENVRTLAREQLLCTGNLVLNQTLWNITRGLVPQDDVLHQSPVFKSWKKRASREKGWGAMALYGTVPARICDPEGPWYHQIFPQSGEPDGLQSSLYVSIAGKNDPANPPGQRVFTATLHVESEPTDVLKTDHSKADAAQKRAEFSTHLVKRMECALGIEISNVESAVPETFARYTGRWGGMVGGFVLRHRNFLFFAAPARLVHPNQKTKLLVVGDTVFPGQGVVSCSVSGIIAWERATGLHFDKTFPLR